MPKSKAAEPLFDQLSKTLETDGEELVIKLKVHTCFIFGCQSRLAFGVLTVPPVTMNRLVKEIQLLLSGSRTAQD